MKRAKRRGVIPAIVLGVLATLAPDLPRNSVWNFLISSAQAQVTNDQSTDRGVGFLRAREVRMAALRSRRGSVINVIYWADGSYIPAALDAMTDFFSEVAGRRVPVSAELLDYLAALQGILDGRSLIIERVVMPVVPSGPVFLGLSSPGRDPAQLCNAFAVIKQVEPSRFCTPETGSTANPVLIGSFPHFYALSW